MTGLAPISPAVAPSTPLIAVAPAQQSDPAGFAGLLSDGVHQLEARVAHADAMVAAFSVDDSVPVHQVTIALEQARLSVELAMQVRTKLVDAFHELMTMQL